MELGIVYKAVIQYNIFISLQGAGYKADIQYNTFLYPNESEIRRMLTFLVNRLPKESVDTPGEHPGEWVGLNIWAIMKITNIAD